MRQSRHPRGFGGLEFASGVEGLASLQLKANNFDPVAVGARMLRAHNDWCIRVASLSPRLRPVAAILAPTLRELLAEDERVIAGGVRGINLPTGSSTEGKPPCHPESDPLWRLMADNNIPLLLHIGGEKPFLREPNAWVNFPQFYTNQTLPNDVDFNILRQLFQQFVGVERMWGREERQAA
jgi:Amidohydrolase